MLELQLFPDSSDSPLLDFKSVLVNLSLLHVAVFQLSLVRSSSCVSRSNDSLQPLGEVVKLNREVVHSIHEG